MISALWLLLFLPAAFGLGMLCLAMLITAKENDVPNEPRQESHK